MLRPKMVTNSTDVRFNAWVAYFQRQAGYTVEYHDFDDLPNMVDNMYRPVGSPFPQPLMELVFAKTVKLQSLGPDFEGGEFEAMTTRPSVDNPVTVYYDDHENIMFIVGNAYSSRFFYAARATDQDATYGYYSIFGAAEEG